MRLMLTMLLVLLSTLTTAFASAPFDPFKNTGIDRKSEAIVPLDLAFRDESGHAVTLRDLSRGKPIVLVPVLHN